MPAPEKWISDASDKALSAQSGQAQLDTTQSEIELAYDAYISSVMTLNLVTAKRQPMDITIPDWPDLPPGSSVQCTLAYILALGAFIQMATHCINANHPNDVATQDCIDYWYQITVAAISGCVAQE